MCEETKNKEKTKDNDKAGLFELPIRVWVKMKYSLQS